MARTRACGPGALLGVYDYLFDTGTYRTRARANEPCRLLAIEIAALSRLIFRFPSVRGRLAPSAASKRLCTFPLIGHDRTGRAGFSGGRAQTVKCKEGDTVYHAGESNGAGLSAKPGPDAVGLGRRPHQLDRQRGDLRPVQRAVSARRADRRPQHGAQREHQVACPATCSRWPTQLSLPSRASRQTRPGWRPSAQARAHRRRLGDFRPVQRAPAPAG